MKTLKKINSIVIILLLTGCFSNEENNILKMGKYYFHDRKCAHDYIILRENGTYEHAVSSKDINYRKTGTWREDKENNSITLYNYYTLYKINGVNCEFMDTLGKKGGSINYRHSYGILTLGDDAQYTHEYIYDY